MFVIIVFIDAISDMQFFSNLSISPFIPPCCAFFVAIFTVQPNHSIFTKLSINTIFS